MEKKVKWGISEDTEYLNNTINKPVWIVGIEYHAEHLQDTHSFQVVMEYSLYVYHMWVHKISKTVLN